MFNKYFQEQLNNLKEAASEYSKAHPALAPMLGEPSSDPDVDRIFEGVAFLTGLIEEKIGDQFPEIIHELTRLFWPHYLRVLPSTTIVKFTPANSLTHPAVISSGIFLDSKPIDGATCRFQTCFDLELHPLELLQASFEEPSGQPAFIKFVFKLENIPIGKWNPKALRFFLGGSYQNATELYLLLSQNLNRIIIRSERGKQSCYLSPDHLRSVGFSEKENLFPYPTNSFLGFRLLQEYFLMPEKFLFLELAGWEKWKDRDDVPRFEVCFELKKNPLIPPKINKDNIVLFATPAVNLFPHHADPIRLDHKKTEYRIRPTTNNLAQHQIYSVEKVTGVVNHKEREYKPFHKFTSGAVTTCVYNESIKYSPLRDGLDYDLSLAYPHGVELFASESLSIDITCTNGHLPENLGIGDICVSAANSPEFATFSNIRVPTASVTPPLDSNFLWRLLSHLSLNYLSLADSQNLRSLLELYALGGGAAAHKKRLAGIEQITTKNLDRFVSGNLMRGMEIRIKMRSDHFAGKGDLYLFGSVLDNFFGLYAAINTFIKLVVEDVYTGEQYSWPARVGNRQLL